MAVRYIVNDVRAAVEFYTHHLGFRLDFGKPGFAILVREDLTLFLNEPGAGGAGHAGERDGVAPAPGGWNRFQIQVDDVLRLYSSVRASGIPVLLELEVRIQKSEVS